MRNINTTKKVYEELDSKFHVNNLYRYQSNNISGSSLKHLVVNKDNKCINVNNNGSIYFSRNYTHHKYFVSKRLKQEVNNSLLENDLPIIATNNVRDPGKYRIIKEHILQNYNCFNSESIGLVFSDKLFELIKNNSVKQEEKVSYIDIPELSDRRKYGGSYGISNQWLDLLHSSVLFYNVKEIDYDDVLNYLYKTRINNTCSSKTDASSFLDVKKPYTYINQDIYSPYHKFILLEKLEKIIDSKNYKPNSNLAKNPTKTISEIIEEYKMLRENILIIFEQKYEDNIMRLKR